MWTAEDRVLVGDHGAGQTLTDDQWRHIAVGTQGLLPGVVVHAASIHDADGAGSLLNRVKPLYRWLRVVFADGGYNRVPALLACFLLGIVMLIISRPSGASGFVLLPRRWVVERTFGWLGRWRRPSKDYEQLLEVSVSIRDHNVCWHCPVTARNQELHTSTVPPPASAEGAQRSAGVHADCHRFWIRAPADQHRWSAAASAVSRNPEQ